MHMLKIRIVALIAKDTGDLATQNGNRSGPTELATLFFAIFREDEKTFYPYPKYRVHTLRASASQPQRLSCIIPHLTYHNKDIAAI
jgi:hypothetical protein